MKLDRNQRQDLSITKWLDSGGKGITLLPTGFGKTRVAMKLIQRLKTKHPQLRCIVVVPSDYLFKQWNMSLKSFNITDVVTVYVINTAITLDLKCHLLIADEVHMFCSNRFINVFDTISHKYFLGLTATLDRLDGKEKLLLDKYPIIDHVSLDEAIRNEWVSPFKQYKVEISVDLKEYDLYNNHFSHHFAFFGHNFKIAMACAKSKSVRVKYASLTGQDEKNIMLHAMQFMRSMAKRKAIVYDHPKKIELTNLIINSRKNSKIITFTKNVRHAEQVCCGDIYHAKLKKKEKDEVVLNFNKAEKGVLNTCKALDVGADIEGVNVGVIMSGDSSNISKKQKIGRAIRFVEGKIAEIFTFVLKNTVEESWFTKSNKDLDYTVIQDYQLEDLLNGNEIKESLIDGEEFIFVL